MNTTNNEQTFRNQNHILVCPYHLGEAATEEQTRDLIAELQERGWSVGYGDNGSWKLSSGERAEFDADFEDALFNSVTDDQIEALYTTSGQVGDMLQCRICELALGREVLVDLLDDSEQAKLAKLTPATARKLCWSR